MVMSNKVRILVVDDEEDICEWMSLVLSQCGYTVATQTDSTKVTETLRKSQFHIVILDLMMPKMDGLTLLDQIRKVDDDIAVVVFTGNPSVESAIRALRGRVSDYIKKPCDVDELNETIEKILRNKGLVVQSRGGAP
jgi:DNA-binding NtrC family response regulator